MDGLYARASRARQYLGCATSTQDSANQKTLARLAHGAASVRPVVEHHDDAKPGGGGRRQPVTQLAPLPDQQNRRGSRLAASLAVTETGSGPSSNVPAAALPVKYRHSMPPLRRLPFRVVGGHE